MKFANAAARAEPIPQRLGRYRLIQSIGPTAMGSAYLGRDRMAGRDVRVHVLRPDRAADPAFVAHLFRRLLAIRAMAADAIAPTLDFGEDRGAVYVVLGTTPGQSLGDLIRNKTPMAPEAAASLVLHAARALSIAHENGLPHGGLTGDSFWRGDDGRVWLVDLGQAIAPVDHDLERARAVAKRSRKEEQPAPSIPRLAAVERAEDVAALTAILTALLAGERWPGFPSLAGKELPVVIADLEAYLGIPPGPLSPPEEVVAELESALLAYESPPLARQALRIEVGVVAGCVVLGLFAALLRLGALAAGFLALALFTATARTLVSGMRRGSPVFSRLRVLALGRSWGDWLSLAAILTIFGVSLAVLGILKGTLALLAAAILVAIGLDFELDRKLDRIRQPVLDRIRGLLVDLRSKGISEQNLRRFVWKFGGDRNVSFFAAIFGFEAVADARRSWGTPDWRLNPRDLDAWLASVGRLGASLTIPLLNLLDERLFAQETHRDLERLPEIEERGGVALGVNLLTSRRRARRVVAAMLAQVGMIRSRRPLAAEHHLPASSVLEAADDPEPHLLDSEPGFSFRREGRVLLVIVGSRTRFLSGLVLIAGCLAWMHQNEVVSAAEIKAMADEAVRSGDASRLQEAAQARMVAARAAASVARPLQSPIFTGFTASLFRDFSPGIAGLLLILSTVFSDWRKGLGALALAILIVFTHPFGFLTRSS